MACGGKERILVINPGATSTKIAVYDGNTLLFHKKVEHSIRDLEKFDRIFDQYQYRMNLIFSALAEKSIDIDSLAAVVGRGGLLKPIPGGTYEVNELMLRELEKAERGEHASNLGAVIAYQIAKAKGIPAYIVDPVSVDEMEPVARISGMPELPRPSMSHALNMKAVARKVAAELGKKYEEACFVVVHLGTGISVAPHKNGKMVDVNNAMEEGPFSLDRCGGLPSYQLVRLCYSGKYSYQEMKEKTMGKGGIYAYLKTKDLREVEVQAAEGNEQASFLIDVLCYQVSKEIGAMATVFEGKMDGIILTGGIAYSKVVTEKIKRHVEYIAPVFIVPGEEEMEHLALGALRVLRNEEKAKIYR